MLALPRLAFASVVAGFCDERGASAIAPLVVWPLYDEGVKPAAEAAEGQKPAAPEAGEGSKAATAEAAKDSNPVPIPEPAALCERGQGGMCSCEEGRPLAPALGDVASLESLALPAAGAAVKALWVEVTWPAAARSSGPLGWSRPVEHPPRG